MKKKQTALQWFLDKLPHSIETQFSEQIQEALKMEHKQITDAYSTYAFDEHGMRIHSSQYYKETYGGHLIDHISDVSKMVGGKDE